MINVQKKKKGLIFKVCEEENKNQILQNQGQLGKPADGWNHLTTIVWVKFYNFSLGLIFNLDNR